jgi:hypothetical protein
MNLKPHDIKITRCEPGRVHMDIVYTDGRLRESDRLILPTMVVRDTHGVYSHVRIRCFCLGGSIDVTPCMEQVRSGIDKLPNYFEVNRLAIAAVKAAHAVDMDPLVAASGWTWGDVIAIMEGRS